jgi:hypothetical protein
MAEHLARIELAEGASHDLYAELSAALNAGQLDRASQEGRVVRSWVKRRASLFEQLDLVDEAHVLGVQLTPELKLGGLASIRHLLRNWIRLDSIPSDANPARWRSSVRAFSAGVMGEPAHADLVTGLDADVSFGPTI